MPASYSWDFAGRTGRSMSMGGGSSAPSSATYVDFTAQSTQDPLSLAGTWSNNTQGVGGNAAPNILSNMRIALADNGTTKIAMSDSVGQDPPNDYKDSFAFLPGVAPVTGDFDITATIYKKSGYALGDHELEIIIGCRTYIDGSSRGCHSWMEMLLNAGGGAAIIRLGGGAAGASYPGSANDFDVLTGQIATVVPVDGSIWRVTKVGNVYTSIVDGTTVATYTGAQSGLGDGAGMATYWHPANGAVANQYGFKNITISGT